MTYSTDNNNDSTVYDNEPDEILYDVIDDDYGDWGPSDDDDTLILNPDE